MDDQPSPALADMLDQGMLQKLDDGSLESFISQDGLCVLFFTGGKGRTREAHDVAVALREIMRDYPGLIRAAVLEEALEKGQQPRFRVTTPPSLVLVAGGRALEVVPGVRDWADYEVAFRRYLGSPRREVSA